MKQFVDESGKEYGFDTSDMHLFKDEEMTIELSMDSITKEQLAVILGGEPIIRCKDCKHWNNNVCWVDMDNVYDVESMILDRYAEDYCSKGERKCIEKNT